MLISPEQSLLQTQACGGLGLSRSSARKQFSLLCYIANLITQDDLENYIGPSAFLPLEHVALQSTRGAITAWLQPLGSWTRTGERWEREVVPFSNNFQQTLAAHPENKENLRIHLPK